MVAIDTNSNVSSKLEVLKARDVSAVGRYYSSAAWKRLTAAEAKKIDAAGIRMFAIFEDDGDPELTDDMGLNHAQLAVSQAQAVGQPEGSAIYFALEHLPNGYTSNDVDRIKDYIAGVKAGLSGRYKLGVYSDGVVLAALLDTAMCDYAWLSASRAFPGSQSFYASGRWALAQDPHIDQKWDGLSVDVDEAAADFGAFRLAALAAPAGGPSPVASADEAAAPSAFAKKAATTALEQWTFFGRQTYDLAGRVVQRGHTEGEEGFYERVGTYWQDGTNTHGIDGRNHDVPWSAAFISWVMRTAGAGDRFRYSTQHSVYIFQGIRDFLQKRAAAGYWTVRLAAAAPQVGDLVCWAREDGVDYDHQKGGNYKGHADLVVEVMADSVTVVGGNVGDSVTKRPLRRDGAGFLLPTVQGGETLFALMQCRL
ncbi:MAG: DUF2272 domain-containing protein [Alphaproteobacteria bacterium]|nr:DUF2272 domain-containing protein [Alphaproteobacteria bacterium]MBV8410187.1 DUF2272 domain-containing protein [Alphaproteobacteria bacterium]